MNKSTSTTSSAKKRLNPKQELFCQLYATDREFFGNGIKAYAKAYGLDLNKKKEYGTARANSSRLLKNADILARTRKLMNLGIMSEERVDKELAFLIEQDAELRTKLGAISEYNKLNNRIQNKLDLCASEGIKITIEEV